MNWITVLGAIASVFTILSGVCTLCLFLSRKDSDGKEKDCRRIHVEGFGNRCVVVQLSSEEGGHSGRKWVSAGSYGRRIPK